MTNWLLLEGIHVSQTFLDTGLSWPSCLIQCVFKLTGIYGGNMLGVRSVSGLAFYDWDTTDLVRRIEITPRNVNWFSF